MVGMGLIEPTPIKSSAPSREKSPKLAEIRVSKNVGVWFGSAAWLQNIRNRNMLKQQTMALKCLKCLKSALGLINSANIYVYIIYIIHITINFSLGQESARVGRRALRDVCADGLPDSGETTLGRALAPVAPVASLSSGNWHAEIDMISTKKGVSI